MLATTTRKYLWMYLSQGVLVQLLHLTNMFTEKNVKYGLQILIYHIDIYIYIYLQANVIIQKCRQLLSPLCERIPTSFIYITFHLFLNYCTFLGLFY